MHCQGKILFVKKKEFSTVSLFLSGSIYILPDYFCFFSTTLGKEVKKIWYMEEISEIEQKEEFLFIKNSEDEKDWCFSCFLNEEIDACQNIIVHLLEKKNIQLATIHNDDFSEALTSMKIRQPTDYEASSFEETEEGLETDDDSFEESDEELPEKKSKFHSIFSDYFEKKLEIKLPEDENPIHQDFCNNLN
jgi:hypothetical protein